jgi:hypothetical protein
MITEQTILNVGVYAVGTNPIDTNGEKYISETNRWFPVWLYVTVICEDLLSVEESNMGFYPKHLQTVISEKNSIEVAHRLLESIKNGNAKEYGDKNFLHDETFTFSIEDVESFAVFCGLSGGFSLS